MAEDWADKWAKRLRKNDVAQALRTARHMGGRDVQRELANRMQGMKSMLEREEESETKGETMTKKQNVPQALDKLLEKPSKPDRSDAGSGIDVPDYEDAGYSGKEGEASAEDLFPSAIKMAFLGTGQGGGRIAEAFYGLGYRRIVAVNTTEQDLASLSFPAKMVIGNDRGGAGKDPEEGRKAAMESYEDVMDLLMRTWGEGVEQMYVCVGGGGGSGTGSWPVLLDAVREYAKSTNVEKPFFKHLGVIMTLPKRSEGSRVQRNARIAIDHALEQLEAGKIFSLVIVDNAKIHELFPGLPVKKFWQVANHNFAAVLHTFNLLASQDSAYNSFDRADFRSMVRNGMMVFGMTKLNQWKGREDISKAVRQNLKETLLADGFDLSKADMAGAIVLAHDDVLGEIPMENIDYAFNSLGRSLGNEGITLHSGIYESKKPGMRVFTIISGLNAPRERLEELETLAR
jgi:cell division protein FtsZ